MNYQIKTTKNYQQKTDCLVVAVKQLKKIRSQQAELNKLTDKSIDRLQDANLLSGVKGEIVLLPIPSGIAAKNIIFIGIGADKKLDTEAVRELLQGVAKRIKLHKFQNLTFDLAALVDKSDMTTVSRHCLEALGDSQYQFTKQPKAANDSKTQAKLKCILWCGDRTQITAAKKGASIGLAVDKGKTLAKNLGNLPGNVCTPSYLAKQAKSMAKSHHLKVKVLEEKDMAKLKMGSLLSVSKGSRQAAKLIIMEYSGAKNKKDAPHVLVGKGLTFDAGGISLKPGAKMDEMKYDMCGGASVFGTMLAVSELALPINVVGIVPSSENLPDGIATKPGDVVTSMAGITIEVLNTDAEGRLILCDALTYSKRYNPKTVIDIATLTGAVIVALGHQTAGLMGNDQEVVNNLLAAGNTSLDTAWQLPLKNTYKKQLKSDYADLANIGSPGAGTITAGAFLSCFTEDMRWAHLDIAGTAWGGAAGKRATGRAVPILTQYIMDRC